jgi:hypothetical protein
LLLGLTDALSPLLNLGGLMNLPREFYLTEEVNDALGEDTTL